MSPVLFGRIPHLGQLWRPAAPRMPVAVTVTPRKLRPRPAPVSMVASPRPPSPGSPAPESKGRFFEGVTRRLMEVSRRDGADSSSGQWAGRFAAALNQYVAAEVALAAMPRPITADADEAPKYKAARRRVADLLDVVLRMRERAPDDVIAWLGELPRGDQDIADTIAPIGVWASLSRALTLSRMLIVSPAMPPALLSASPADPVGSLDHLRHLLEAISEARIDLPEVTRWSIDIKEALAGFDAAEEKLRNHGPGLGGLHVFNALQCCEQLLELAADENEHAFPLRPSTFTHPKASFDASQRWIDAASDYTRGGKMRVSKCERVCDFLRARRYDLKSMSLPYESLLN